MYVCVRAYIHIHMCGSTCAYMTGCVHVCTCGVYGVSSKRTVCGRGKTQSFKEMFPNFYGNNFPPLYRRILCLWYVFQRLPPGLLWCLFIYTKSNSLRKLCFKIFISSLQFCCLSLVMTSKYLNRKIMPRVNFVKRSPSSAFIDMMLCELVALSIFSDNFHIQKCQSWNCTRFQYCMKHISDKPEGYIVGVKNGKSKTTQSSHFNA